MVNLNKLSVEKIKIDYNETPNNRAKLDTGPLCNYKCEFCYYIDRLHEKTDLDIIKERADDLLAKGITEVDLSGGESSIHPQWFDLLDYCNERFEHISCLSHGGKFSNIDFLKKSQEHGLKEVLFSVHGSTPEIHDGITNRKQSFAKIIQAINNAKELGIIVRINCTVYEKNYKELPTAYADLINELQPLELNFITLNYWESADSKFGDYKEVTDHVKLCIDRLEGIKYINVRYTPYCYMKGYEKHLCGHYQHIYDVYDWNKGIYHKNLNIPLIDRSFDQARHDRETFYTKPIECLKCSHFTICDGIENEIAGHTEVKPIISDERITDILHYRKGFYEAS